ncbi:MAG: CopK family periplasmic copper-binding protein [Gammaproteobacteria bacterium]|nr:CopK family periplasmic copper-binding protein [Gammaproteobacteria bacterium]
MKTLLSTLLVFSLLGAPALASDGAAEQVRLKDGSTLYVNEAGEMRMIDGRGNKMSMRDGVPMETEDGRVIMMKNNMLWQRMERGSLNPKLAP